MSSNSRCVFKRGCIPFGHVRGLSHRSVKTRIQADKNTENETHGKVKKNLGIVQTLIAIIKSKEGPVALYRGFLANMANSFIQRMCVAD